MPKDRKHSLGYAASAAAIVLVFAVAWTVLDRSEHEPRWLTVEAPPFAAVGESLEFRVRLKETVAATRISCTLHRAGSDRKIQGSFASSGPARKAAGSGTHVFRFEVPDIENAVFVSAVICLSPTGSWQDRTRAAHTRLIPIHRDRPAGDLRVFQKTRVYRSTTAAEDAAALAAAEAAAREPLRQVSSWDHRIFFIILLATAVLCLVKAGKKRPDARPEKTMERTIWLAFAAVLVLSAILELSDIIGHLVAWGRRLTREQNIYHVRKTFQKAIMAAVAAAGFGLSILYIKAMRKPGSHRHLWGVGAGLAVYLSVSFVSVLSFHAVDAVRGITWCGVSAIDGARGAGALVSLMAAVFALGAKSGQARG